MANRENIGRGPLAFVVLSTMAWLMPNHYAPWTTAWNDAVAIVSLLVLSYLFLFLKSVGTTISPTLLGTVLVAGVTTACQLIFGKLLFSGDAWMVALYLGLWLTAVWVGHRLAESPNREEWLSALVYSWLFAAILSVGIALAQKTGSVNLGIFMAELPPGGRPFANLAQPNNFCTLSFIGICGLLLLRQIRAVGRTTFWLGVTFLCLGMVASQSRTGWLQMGLLAMWGIWAKTKVNLWISRSQIGLMLFLYVATWLLWPLVCDALLLEAGRSLEEQMSAGIRLPFWGEMLDAIGREPLWGYGWQQVAVAQQRVALDHPGVGVLFEHSHNLVLDLLLWNGIPAGSLIIGLLLWWFGAHIRGMTDGRKAWLLVAVGGVFLHNMLEFPLEYAGFLISTGLMMGAIDGLTTASSTTAAKVSRLAITGLVTSLSLVFALVVVDYLKVEENYRNLRMESARIGVSRITSEAPDLRLLNHLEAFLQFARTEAAPGMSEGDVSWMRTVSERFPFPPVMFRYALAAGLNGQLDVAHETLARLCKIHEHQRCLEAHEGWAQLQKRYPQLGLAQLEQP